MVVVPKSGIYRTHTQIEDNKARTNIATDSNLVSCPPDGVGVGDGDGVGGIEGDGVGISPTPMSMLTSSHQPGDHAMRGGCRNGLDASGLELNCTSPGLTYSF